MPAPAATLAAAAPPPDPRHAPVSPRAFLATFSTHWGLITQMTRREVIGRYKGSIFGLLWSFFNPLLMLAVYTFAFAVVFQAHWNNNLKASQWDYALNVFAGLILFVLYAESVNAAPKLMFSYSSYVKRVIFPLEILPVVNVGAGLVHACIGALVLVAFQLALHHTLHWSMLFWPVIVLDFSIFVLAVCWFVAALGVYVRDVAQSIAIITILLNFVSPVFFSVHQATAGHAWLRWFFLINPLSFPMEASRDVIIAGHLPNLWYMAAYTAGALLLAWLGFVWFQKTKKGFADVM